MKKYDHKKIEKKWQMQWEKDNVVKIDKDDQSKEKFFILDMFPYPSGNGLHMGHTESYTASDVFYRFKKMQGYNVLHPQGFDAFGLPAENYAIKTGIPPVETTEKNIAIYISQMRSLGLNYDFDEMINTSSPEYYKWTQWLFGKFFENNLVYKKTSKVNWCSSCQTVIANEQVVGGNCERCGTQIEQREIPGWFFKITNFADDLIQDLGKIDWPEYTKKNQINWIGRSEGAKIQFPVKGSKQEIKVFTTRPDTLFGATYMVLAPEHKLIQELKDQIENWNDVNEYIEKTKNKTELDRLEAKEKTGVKIKGVKVINPANKEEIPVFVADYVLSGYGTGAIMAVPAHDERDFEFAKKFGLEIKEVIYPNIIKYTVIEKSLDKCENNLRNFGEIKVLSVDKDWGHLYEISVLKEKEQDFIKYLKNNLLSEEISGANSFYTDSCGTSNLVVFRDNVFKVLTNQGLENFKNYGKSLGIPGEQLDIKPRVFAGSGQVVNSEKFNGMNSEEAKEKMIKFVRGETTTNYRLRDWSMSRQRYWGCPIPVVYSPEGEAKLVPEEHLPWLLPTDVDFVPTGESPLVKSKEFKERTEEIFGKGWFPEYDTMDTFVDSSWYFLRYPDVHNNKEFCSESREKYWLPVDLYIGGAEHTYMHLLFSRFFVKAMKQIGLLDFDEPFIKLRHQGMVLDSKGKKMSKSKGNVINPNDMVERFGADSVRTYMLFAAPLEDEVIWNEDNIVGVYRFLERVWRVKDSLTESSNKVVNALHKTIKKVSKDIEDLRYNTAISEMMKFMNIVKDSTISKQDFEIFLRLLAPFAPHITEEIWENLEYTKSIHLEEWPKYNDELVKDEKCIIVIQVNGKVRSEIEVMSGEDEENVKKQSLKNEKVQKWLNGGFPKKIIYIKDKLVNIVI